jgi:stage II sporulation protein D
MILRVLLLLLTCVPLTSNLQAALWSHVTGYFKEEKPDAPTIRVLIEHDKEGIGLEVRGKYSLYDPYKQEYLSTRFIGKNRYLETLSDGLKWGEAFPGLYQLQIKPEDREAFTIVDGRPYLGSLYIYDIGGTISIVNQIFIEDYMSSILSQYDHLSLHPETLASLAIAARTNACFQMLHPKTSYWAVDSQKVNYRGNVQVRNPAIIQAIKATQYMVMSQTGVYERVLTPFLAQFGPITPPPSKEMRLSKISLEEANQMAQEGAHAAQILSRAFPGITIMLMQQMN